MSDREFQTLEAVLEKIWEKARNVSENLLRLKEENKELRQRLKNVIEQEERLKLELQGREEELRRLRSELSRLRENGSQFINPEEKEALKAKIKELINKINSHL